MTGRNTAYNNNVKKSLLEAHLYIGYATTDCMNVAYTLPRYNDFKASVVRTPKQRDRPFGTGVIFVDSINSVLNLFWFTHVDNKINFNTIIHTRLVLHASNRTCANNAISSLIQHQKGQ